MKRWWVSLIYSASVLACLTSCGPAQRMYYVSSYPPGARIFVNDKERGQTAMKQLKVVFYPYAHATLRLELDGYQSEGLVLAPDSPGRLDFQLQRAPDPQRTQEQLDEIQARVEEILTKLQTAEGNQP